MDPICIENSEGLGTYDLGRTGLSLLRPIGHHAEWLLPGPVLTSVLFYATALITLWDSVGYVILGRHGPYDRARHHLDGHPMSVLAGLVSDTTIS